MDIQQLQLAQTVLTGLLMAAAVAAAIVGWKNLRILRGQFRQNTFLSLLRELSEENARKNRQLIFQNLPSSSQVTNIKAGILRDDPSIQRYKDAIEETVSCLDRVGFFLLKEDPKLKDEAPKFIWEITSQMWARTEWYVSHRRQVSKEYGKYFEKLNKEAEKQGYIDKLKTKAT